MSEFDDNECDEDFEGIDSVLATRAMLALTGNFLGGPLEVKNTLYEFLLSDAVITPHFRKLLADAILHGGYRDADNRRVTRKNRLGYAMPSLAIEGLGEDGEFGKEVLIKREWLNRGEEVEREIAANAGRRRNVDLSLEEVKGRAGVTGGTDYLKKARRFYQDYLKHRDTEDMRNACVDRFGVSTVELYNEENYLDITRTVFIEDRVRDSTAWR